MTAQSDHNEKMSMLFSNLFRSFMAEVEKFFTLLARAERYLSLTEPTTSHSPPSYTTPTPVSLPLTYLNLTIR